MIKKLFIIIAALVPVLAVSQQTVGNWKIFPSFNEVEKIVESPSKVYYLSSTKTLFSYDKDTEESYMYGIDNKLTDTGISSIYYNNLSNYLAVAYSSGIIDVLYDDGKVVQLPDIKNALMSSSKNIKDITFAPGRMLVTTDFGLVLYDDVKMEVKDSGVYDQSIEHALITDRFIVIVNTDYNISFMPVEKKLNNFNNFVMQTEKLYSTGFFYLNDNKFISFAGDNRFAIVTYDVDQNKMDVESANYPKVYSSAPTARGYLLYNADNYFDVDFEGNYTVYDIPDELKSSKLSAYDDPERLWAGNAEGIALYDVKGGNLSVINDKMKPAGLTMKKVGRIYSSPSGKVFISYLGYSKVFTADWPTEKGCVNVYQNGKISEATPRNLTLTNTTQAGANDGSYTPVSIFNIVEDPDDPDTYYFPCLYDGVFKITGGEEASVYNTSTSTFYSNGSTCRAHAIDIDSHGNLWVLFQPLGDATAGSIHVLSAAGRKKEATTAADWESHYIPGWSPTGDGRILACKKSNMVFAWYYYNKIVAIDTNGTASTADDTVTILETVTDQDGKVLSLGTPGWMIEDNNGQVWIGGLKCIFSIANPSKVSQPGFTVNHLKVPRNDGTNYADYLLDGEWVLCMDVDNSNRKWISTYNSGVYLVSEDGSNILEHFTTENSLLPENKVYAVSCDKTNNAVYFGTMQGVLQYNSTSSPAADDYSDVYAYPNPVRPEYTGWIVVRGLMDNSLVKIADAAGNVLYQGVSEGGMITWDGCGLDGKRVGTGVYYVFASQNVTGSSSSAVTKILVVK